MRTPARRVSGSRPRSKSSLSDNPTDSNQDSVTDGHPIPPSPAPSTTVPVIAQKSPPPDTPNPPRRNGRRRYTPRQVPFSASLHTAQPPSPTNPSHRNPPDNNVAQFVSLTQQLNGQMDGVVEYSLPGGQWESGMLYIDVPSMSLNRHYGSEGSQHIISDLRGCQVDKVNEEGRIVLVIRAASNTVDVTLRPPIPDVEKWFAALYRWRSVSRSASNHSLKSLDSTKSTSPPAPRTPSTPRPILDIKIGSMLLLPNRRVKAILKDSGLLSILSEAAQRGDDEQLLYSIHLYTLQRSAIQLIDPSLSSHPFGFVIHAHLRESGTKPFEMRKMPIYLALETRLQMEVWFVMLKCYASPELYGPPSLSPSETFRCQRSLSLRIMEGRKLHRSDGTVDSTREKELDTYCEILIEGEIRGKTSVKKGTLRPLWTEDFKFLDLPDHVDDVSILLRYIRRNRDLVLGKVSLSILDTEMGVTNQKWHPLAHTARDGLSVEFVGELDLKYKLEELVILTSDDYSEIRKLLLDFDNRLTLDIAKTVQDLDTLADRLVHIFLADNQAVDWLVFLANKEITAQFAQPKVKVNQSTDPTEIPSEGAEAHQQQTIKQEATRTLFRGNSLLTKSLMKFMEKVGRDYLEETLGSYLRYVVAISAIESCEVDPAHLKPHEDLDENWARLLKHIREVWNRILVSAPSCPREFKEIFSRIQAKVIETAGNIPAISFARYTCISAFIFLRFFMPAVLNPSLCGIIRQPPDEAQRRTLLLISKGLQGVSNMSGYGGKEKWILPMGTLSAEYEDQFTAFIDQICTVTSVAGPRQPAQYSGPMLVKSRLDALSQEGIPTLPFLIDQPREYAGLIKLWNRQVFSPVGSKKHHSIDVSKLGEATKAYHLACVQLEMKTVRLVEAAVEREEEELSESEAVEEEVNIGVSGMNLQNHSLGSLRLSKKEVYRKQSFSYDEEYSSSPPKRALDAVLPGFLRKRGSEREKRDDRDRL